MSYLHELDGGYTCPRRTQSFLPPPSVFPSSTNVPLTPGFECHLESPQLTNLQENSNEVAGISPITTHLTNFCPSFDPIAPPIISIFSVPPLLTCSGQILLLPPYLTDCYSMSATSEASLICYLAPDLTNSSRMQWLSIPTQEGPTDGMIYVGPGVKNEDSATKNVQAAYGDVVQSPYDASLWNRLIAQLTWWRQQPDNAHNSTQRQITQRSNAFMDAVPLQLGIQWCDVLRIRRNRNNENKFFVEGQVL